MRIGTNGAGSAQLLRAMFPSANVTDFEDDGRATAALLAGALDAMGDIQLASLSVATSNASQSVQLRQFFGPSFSPATAFFRLDGGPAACLCVLISITCLLSNLRVRASADTTLSRLKLRLAMRSSLPLGMVRAWSAVLAS